VKIFEEGTGSELPPAPASSESSEVGQSVDRVALEEASITESAPEPAAVVTTDFSPEQKSKLRLATALNVGLSSVGGAWLAAVPGTALLSGEVLGGFSVGLPLSVALILTYGGFLRYHPLISTNYYPVSYGLIAVDRKRGTRRHITFSFLPPPSAEQRALIDADARLQLKQVKLRAELATNDRKERKLKRRAIRLDRRAAEVRADILGVQRELLERSCLNGDSYDSRRDLLEQSCIKRSNHG